MKQLGFSYLIWVLLCFISSESIAQPVQTLSVNPVLNGGITMNSAGELFVATSGTNGVLNGGAIYKIDLATGQATQYIGGLQPWPIEMDFDNRGNLFVTDWGLGGVYKFDQDLQRGTFVNGINGANGLEIDTLTQTFYVMSFLQHRVYKVDSSGSKTAFVTGGTISFPAGIAFNGQTKDLYIANWFDNRITKVFADGSQELFVTLPLPFGTGMPACMILGEYLYVSAYGAHKIFRIELESGNISTFAGSGVRGTVDGELLQAEFISPGPMVSSPNGDRIYVTQDSLATTTGGGRGAVRVILLETATSVGEDLFGDVPIKFQVNANYPNPFNPTTTISFELLADEHVKISIYNALGQIIKTLLDENLNGGGHRLQWDGTNYDGFKVTSGVYYYRIEAGKNSSVKPMLLVQ